MRLQSGQGCEKSLGYARVGEPGKFSMGPSLLVVVPLLFPSTSLCMKISGMRFYTWEI